mmetsp:Transcript_14437/g.33017  ORF Transcript_14437/g.33017 Transcript_14437/m.33017 type:complete len:94 (+) Transcript_14437:123-404(+)
MSRSCTRSRDPSTTNLLELDALEAGSESEELPVVDAIGKLECIVLCLFVVLSALVIAKMAIRDWFHLWEPCTPSTIISKHEFCMNVTLLGVGG